MSTGKDVKFHRQYVVEFKGTSKKGGFAGETQTYAEELFDQMITGFIKAFNQMRITQKATIVSVKKFK